MTNEPTDEKLFKARFTFEGCRRTDVVLAVDEERARFVIKSNYEFSERIQITEMG